MSPSRIARYSAITIIGLIIIALLSWYFLIRGRQAELTRADEGRGTDIAQPSFTGAIGSTYQNIVSSLSTLVSGEKQDSDTELPRLAQVGKTPVAGFGFVGTSTSLRLRFVERSTGYLLDIEPKTGALKRLTNTLIPAVYNALITKKGAILQNLTASGVVLTTAGTISASSSAQDSSKDSLSALVQKSLPANIRAITMNPATEKLLYIVPNTEGIRGIRSEWDGVKPEEVFTSAITGWRLFDNASGRAVIAQNPSDEVIGYAYTLSKNGSMEPLLKNLPGLTVLPHPSSKALLYGTSNGSLTLYAQVDEKASRAVLPIRTSADKCVWSPTEKLVAFCAVPQGTLPTDFLDEWNRGEFHTSDAWWRVDVGAASAELLYSPSGFDLDAEQPAVDNSGTYLAFRNARDKSLWLLRIEK